MSRRRFAPFVLALIVALGLLPITPASAARNRPPKIKKAVMKDTDGDGMANKVILTYNERINHRLDTSRFPFRVQGYRILKVNKARRSTRLVIVVKESASAPAKPDFIRYTRTNRQPVKDLKKLQAAKQLFTRNIIGLVITEPPPVEHTLTVQKGGSGTGTVVSNPAGIDCGSTCAADYVDGTEVTLTATPAAEAAPEVAWTGCASNPTATTCTVTMTAAKTVGVTFTAAGQKTLSVSKEGNGTVSSTSTPTQATQINCAAACATTSASYPDATVVKLTATPGQAGMLTTWGGACSGTGATCDLVMDAPKSVTVKFEIPTLTVAKVGSGSVVSNPAGIDCGTDCSGEFAKDADVTLTATPADGWEFTGWTGAGTCADSTTCIVKVDATKEVTATFTLLTGPVMRALDFVVTNGTVQCSADDGPPTACETSYVDGTSLVITGSPSPGFLTPTWGGDCTGSALLTCNLEMTADRSATLTFAPVLPGL